MLQTKINGVNPLILNFITPQKPVEYSTTDEVIYDSMNQISYTMGSSGPSRCNDGYRGTKERLHYGYTERNDAERWTDD